ncbi:MAG: PIN domain-containing protein [Candidatus Sulfotelmatobacter sp.]
MAAGRERNYTNETDQIRLALDTNILAYIEGVNGIFRQQSATEIVTKLPAARTFVPVQVLGELFRVLRGKAKYSPQRTRAAVLNFADIFQLVETSSAILKAAIDLSAKHGLVIWDALILAAAASAGCRLLLSEDLQEGFTWSGVTVTNPFSSRKHTLLAALLEQ